MTKNVKSVFKNKKKCLFIPRKDQKKDLETQAF